MKVFVSWSGDRSRAVAEELRTWLKLLVQSVDPWMSGRDIQPGQRWTDTLADALSESKVGIICLTPDNIGKPWVNFEAGAIAKSVKSARVVPLLIDLTNTDLTGPLASFQALKLDREGVLKLAKMLRDEDPNPTISDQELNALFDQVWPAIDKALQNIPKSQSATTKRSDRELLEEILQVVSAGELTKEDLVEALEAWLKRLEKQEKYLDEVGSHVGAGSAAAAAERFLDWAIDLRDAIDTIKKTYWM